MLQAGALSTCKAMKEAIAAPHKAWSWVLLVVGVGGLALSGQWMPWGWLVGAVVIQSIYFAYGLKTQQRGFCVSAVIYCGVSLWNFWSAIHRG